MIKTLTLSFTINASPLKFQQSTSGLFSVAYDTMAWTLSGKVILLSGFVVILALLCTTMRELLDLVPEVSGNVLDCTADGMAMLAIVEDSGVENVYLFLGVGVTKLPGSCVFLAVLAGVDRLVMLGVVALPLPRPGVTDGAKAEVVPLLLAR